MMPDPKINRDLGERPELCWLPLDQIRVNRDYQRDLKPARLAQILREFEWSRFGALQLAEQEDGSFHVFDGQHRYEAACRHPDVSEVPVIISRFDGGRAEAQAFLDVNVNRTAVTPVEKYWAGIEAGDDEMMAVCAVLEEAECEVIPAKGGKAPNRTGAVQSLRRAIRLYGDAAVIGALRAIRGAWPDDVDSLNGIMIQALARLYRNNNDLKRQHMVSVLAATKRIDLSSAAEAIRKIGGGNAVAALTRSIAELYNRGLRASQQISTGVKL